MSEKNEPNTSCGCEESKDESIVESDCGCAKEEKIELEECC
jgi:hypothetical protein